VTDMLVRVAARWTVPRDVVATMELFGRAEFDAAGLADRRVNLWTDLVGPLLPHARQRPAEFLRQLADAVVPAGGWAVYGGQRWVTELLPDDLDDLSQHRMLDAALDFLRGLGVPPARLSVAECALDEHARAGGAVATGPAAAGRLAADHLRGDGAAGRCP
jgi:hypothetical protein